MDAARAPAAQPDLPEGHELEEDGEQLVQVGQDVYVDEGNEHVFAQATKAVGQLRGACRMACRRRGWGLAVRWRPVSAAFTHRLRVRYSECDPQGVVFNANYVTYFDIALTELWREAIGPYTEMMAGGADMVVAETRVRYLAPARFDDVLDVSIVPTRLGNTALTTSMEIRRGETVVVTGEMRHVFVDVGAGLKRPIPDDVRRGLEPYAAAADDSAAPSEGAAARSPAAGASAATP